MRMKINIISWFIFLVLIGHMTKEKPVTKSDINRYQIPHVHKVVLKKSLKYKSGT